MVRKPTYPSLSYGIQAFLWWNSWTRPRDLEFIRQMRFQYVKQIFDWNDIQPERDLPPNWEHLDAVINEVHYRQLKLIARLGKPPNWALRADVKPGESPFDLAGFATFCGDLAARYKGRVAGYQVWNEPNLDREWNKQPPNAAAYVRMLQACYEAVKKADPDAIVISAGLAPTGGDGTANAVPDEQYLWDMYKAGAAKYYDVLGLNAPGYRSAPETPLDDPSLDGNRWQAFRHVEDMRAIMVANNEGEKQIAILEMGWTIDPRDTITVNGTATPNPYRWHSVTEQQQADYLVRAYAYAASHWRPWVGLMVTIYMADPGWTQNDEEYWWSVEYQAPDYPQMRKAYFALAQMPQVIDGTEIPGMAPGANHTPLPPPPTPKGK
jgi:hypothetical protein